MVRFVGALVLTLALTPFLQAQQVPPPENPRTHDKSYYDPKGRGVLTESDKIEVQEGTIEMSRTGKDVRGSFATSTEKVSFHSATETDGSKARVELNTNHLLLRAD